MRKISNYFCQLFFLKLFALKGPIGDTQWKQADYKRERWISDAQLFVATM